MKCVPALAITALLCLVTGCADASGDAVAPKGIIVASAPNVFLSALYVAKDDGLFANEGLKVDIVEVESGNDSIAALVSGKAQFADVGFEIWRSCKSRVTTRSSWFTTFLIG